MDTSQEAWSTLAHRLQESLGSLTDGAAVVLSEPDPAPAPSAPTRRRLFARKPTPPATRYVQYLRVEDNLVCECVGADSFPGRKTQGWPISPEQDAQLRALGWKAPDQMPAGVSSGNYRVDLPGSRAAQAAWLGVQALRILGLAADTDWQWDLQRG